MQSRSQKIIFKGDNNVVKLFPMWGKGRELILWAERGLICWEDGRTEHGAYGTLEWQEAAERVLGLSEMVVKSSEDPSWQTERQHLQRFICNMEELIRVAREQGSPFDNGESLHDVVAARRRRIDPRQLDQVVAGDDF